MNYKTLIIIFLTPFSMTSAFGQIVKSSTEKREYKIDETITINFEAKLKVDSTTKLVVNNFIVMTGPEISSTYSITDGKKENSYHLSYKIKATRVGKLIIASPDFYAQGELYIALPITLSITGENMTTAELKKIELDRFRENFVKPTGTLRYVLFDSLGYIEAYDSPNWNFVRALTIEEIEQLKKK